MPLLNRITGLEGVAQGASPRVKMQCDRRYHGLKFFFTLAGVATDPTTLCERVRLFVNGKTVRDVPASYLIMIAKLNGITPKTGELPIFFSEPARADKIDEVWTAWPMQDETSFEVELVLKQLAGEDAAKAVGVTGLQSFDYGRLTVDGKEVRRIITQKVISKNAAAGQNDFDNIPIKNPIQRVHLVSSKTINSVEVTADSTKVYETTAAINDSVLNDYGLVTQPGAFPVLFDHRERIDDALPVAADLNIKFDLAEAATVFALVEAGASSFSAV